MFRFRIFFARKANKALALVDEAKRLGLGVDVASASELRQVLDRGVEASDVVVTAAVKPRAMLELCLDSGATIVIDNADELDAPRRAAGAKQARGNGRDAPRAGPSGGPAADPLWHDSR